MESGFLRVRTKRRLETEEELPSTFEPVDPNELRVSGVYSDGTFEFMHVILPRRCKLRTLLTPPEWQRLGVDIGDDWENYAIHRPEPHVLLLRKRLPRGG